MTTYHIWFTECNDCGTAAEGASRVQAEDAAHARFGLRKFRRNGKVVHVCDECREEAKR